MSEEHSHFAASASSRWLSCTASVTLDATKQREQSKPAADRGTMLHKIAEQCLVNDTDPPSKLSPPDADCVQAYVDFVRGREGFKRYEYRTEFHGGCGGTSDTVVVDGRTLEIIDFKTGSMYVDPRENTQLIIYALGVFAELDVVYDFKEIILTIAQPALENYASWTIKPTTLERWGKMIRESVDLPDSEREFVPDEGNCHWCPVKHICPALEKHAVEVAKQDFADSVELSMAEKVAMVPLVQAWCNGVMGEANAMMLEDSDSVPGLKVVAGRAGNRSWEDQKKARRLLEKWGFDETEIYTEPVMITPPKAEALVKKGTDDREAAKSRKDALAKTIKKGEAGAPVIVPESDPRKPIVKADLAKKDFADFVNDEEN